MKASNLTDIEEKDFPIFISLLNDPVLHISDKHGRNSETDSYHEICHCGRVIVNGMVTSEIWSVNERSLCEECGSADDFEAIIDERVLSGFMMLPFEFGDSSHQLLDGFCIP